ncbi:hypothetical protein [Metabacillus sediminilitoris]|nr:hypothetical protein [Metabacillus sediminilitoris]QGQ46141.1 hypothetical protein GMB29_13480 [Metabacillus sediminilitoris]
MPIIIRQMEVNDAENIIVLSNKIGESGFLLYEPDERNTTTEQQRT